MSLTDKRILLIIGGGIAAYKSLDLIRRLRERGARVRAVMTEGACQFITPVSVGALTGERVFLNLFDRDEEQDVGHIRLAREADAVIVAPATADLMAKMANGLAGDLATAVLLACDRPVLVAPAMNPAMWAHPATRRNQAQLLADGLRFVGPNSGEMAESNEAGLGRMAEPMEILQAVTKMLAPVLSGLAGRHVLITSGPTHEPIDPVRYIANRSSGRQGHAIAAAFARAGARVTLVSGPVTIPDPAGVDVVHVESAREMLAAIDAALPADVAVMAAAVADWRMAEAQNGKIKKDGSGAVPALALVENPDILATVGRHATLRPRLVVGFAAETSNVVDNARAKLARKGADMILANDVSPERGVMGGDRNTIHLVSGEGVANWPTLSKTEVAERLVAEVARRLQPAK
ncbi:bifunctional phosphopantothenoylcysteine decarboxylase/phosphopantothenate--cysteine ligase CoaBC [Stappia taiwanensis]|uniref:Coenzyme A biosynthesis bifunctional protein CoaBC n=1 Tax=Stappia taiwanensis TaxID=992267 RepID=A0A838XXQ9_9HYPH|nr:bifunctional phosphopantothenoylcysteine decarboxylase/phosphopantothenate--cysteine ligase CoaBC [Stappia taiwanensis]MBA4611824.1 bifunctional phosphopantothenoylcysteine decarboxylase/phosphopantothenate--cysteine ligase CoaBC [Stappia taiwanensis]GGF03067.1 phosphopantothenate synthase [Stappia taiwanensis]